MAYSPKAISGYWEANSKAEGPGLDAFLLGANVIAYATDKKMPLPRLSTVKAPPETEPKPAQAQPRKSLW